MTKVDTNLRARGKAPSMDNCWQCIFRRMNPRVLAWKCSWGHVGDKRK